MAVGTLGVYVAVAGGFDAPDAETAARARTMAFTTFVFFQLFNIFNARSEHTSAFTRQSFTNAKLWVSLAVVAALQVLVVVAVAALVLVPDEARKLAAGKHPTDGFRQGRDPSTD